MSQRQGGTFLRERSIPREDGREGERKTRFRPTLTQMLFDLSGSCNSQQ